MFPAYTIATSNPHSSACDVTDSIEDTLIAILPSENYDTLALEVSAGKATYPVTMMRGLGFHDVPYYFRAGRYLVINPCLDLYGARDEGFNYADFFERLKQVEEVLFVAGEWRQEMMWQRLTATKGYYLPNTIGCMLALQSLGDELSGRTVLDVGSGNALLSMLALREGAKSAIAIECESREARVVAHRHFRDRFSEEVAQDEKLCLNTQLNRLHEKIEIVTSTIENLAPRTVEGGIAVLNFPRFGMSYMDATDDQVRKSAKHFGNGMIAYYDIKSRESVLKDILEKFSGVETVIVSGGSHCRGDSYLDSDNAGEFLQHAADLGWVADDRIVVSHPMVGTSGGGFDGWEDGKRFDENVDYFTFVLRRQ